MRKSINSDAIDFMKTLKNESILIWNKGNKTGKFYMSQFEYILFFRKGKGKKNNCGTLDILNVQNKK